MFKYDMYKDKLKQQETQTRIFTRTNTEDRRQIHHNSLEPITVGPWCMHTNKGLTIRHKTQHQLQHIIQSTRSNTSMVQQVYVARCISSIQISMSWDHLYRKHFDSIMVI